MPKKRKKPVHRRKKSRAKKIVIYPGNPPTVSDPAPHISKHAQEQVQWTSGSKDWAVIFEGATPFERYYFGPGEPGNKKILGAYGDYKYTVFIEGNSADPNIVVDP